MTRELAFADQSTAARGIMDLKSIAFEAPAHPNEHNEMIKVPMKNCGTLELMKILDVTAKRPAIESDCLRHIYERFQRHAL